MTNRLSDVFSLYFLSRVFFLRLLVCARAIVSIGGFVKSYLRSSPRFSFFVSPDEMNRRRRSTNDETKKKRRKSAQTNSFLGGGGGGGVFLLSSLVFLFFDFAKKVRKDIKSNKNRSTE